MNKNTIKGYLAAAVLLLAAACEKLPELPLYKEGVDPVLTASSTTIAPLPADSNKTALTLSWTDPGYATDSSRNKYIIQMDSAGRNFSKAVTREVTGTRSLSMTAKELNSILLDYGFLFNRAYDVDVRLISSYANNNERRTSNTVKLKATPYKVPPKVPLPSSNRLFIVGDATDGGWTNPVPLPTQELERIDETTFGGIFNLTGGKQYLVLPVNGSWDNKYSVANNQLPGLAAGGDFGFNLNDNFPGPSASGLHKLVMDFQGGKFTLAPFNQQHGLPSQLFIVGDATPGGWSNPVPLPAQQFTRVNSTRFEITLAMTAGRNFLFLPENGSWDKKYGAVDNQAPGIKNGGAMKPEGQDMPSPEATGTYKITVDFMNNTYKLVKQ